MKKLKVGVIGVGVMGRNHVRVYKNIPTVELVGIADTNKSTLDKVSDEFSVKGFTDYRELVELGVDAVSVAVPTTYHADVAKDVIKKGVHLLVEKPLANTLGHGKAIVRAAKKKKVKLMVGHIERFNPAVVRLKQFIDMEELGDILTISAKRVGPFQPRVMDISVLVDCGIHDIDVIRYLLSSEPTEIFSKLRIIRNKYGDQAVVVLYFNEVCAVIEANWFTPHQIRKLFITGTKGIAELDYISQELTIENSECHIVPKIEKQEPLRLELEYFVNCIRNNEEPVIDGEEGLKNLKIAITAEKTEKRSFLQ